MTSIAADYATIERYNREVHAIMRECGIATEQVKVGYKARVSILINALDNHKAFATRLFGSDYKKTFSKHYSDLENLVKHNVEMLVKSLNTNAEKRMALIDLDQDIRNRLCKAHNIHEGNIVDILKAITENQEHISREVYPEWIQAHRDYPIATFWVVHNARNIAAHKKSTESDQSLRSSLASSVSSSLSNEYNPFTRVPVVESNPFARVPVNESNPFARVPIVESSPFTRSHISVNESSPFARVPVNESNPFASVSVNESNPFSSIPVDASMNEDVVDDTVEEVAQNIKRLTAELEQQKEIFLCHQNIKEMKAALEQQKEILKQKTLRAKELELLRRLEEIGQQKKPISQQLEAIDWQLSAF